MIEELEHVITTIDCGAFFPKEHYLRNVVFSKEIDKVSVSCGCVKTHYKPKSKVLRLKWSMVKEFPFQVTADKLPVSQVVTVTFTDLSETKIKLFGYLLNPTKW
jgi:hypothetical protein